MVGDVAVVQSRLLLGMPSQRLRRAQQVGIDDNRLLPPRFDLKRVRQYLELRIPTDARLELRHRRRVVVADPYHHIQRQPHVRSQKRDRQVNRPAVVQLAERVDCTGYKLSDFDDATPAGEKCLNATFGRQHDDALETLGDEFAQLLLDVGPVGGAFASFVAELAVAKFLGRFGQPLRRGPSELAVAELLVPFAALHDARVFM
ncbi:hypothetical protein [Dactylosporangium sp. CA-139066]|uniref:hypothetical protein n=1 Tax=Dactylosporangium sp. CA-139066 TaxID=3239930 RepID=UPI003D8CDC16